VLSIQNLSIAGGGQFDFGFYLSRVFEQGFKSFQDDF
jgi:hypothetical protein